MLWNREPGGQRPYRLAGPRHCLRPGGEDHARSGEARAPRRREVRYGAFSRSLPPPEGVTEADITASYKDGVPEIRIPEPKHEEAKKIAIRKS